MGHLEAIIRDGLSDPYLTDNEEIAVYYAEQEAEDQGSKPVVLAVEVDESMLRYDGAAMDEPVMVPDSQRDEAWEAAGEEHPEWLHRWPDGEVIVVPPEAFEVSLQGARSVRVEGTVTDWSET